MEAMKAVNAMGISRKIHRATVPGIDGLGGVGIRQKKNAIPPKMAVQNDAKQKTNTRVRILGGLSLPFLSNGTRGVLGFSMDAETSSDRTHGDLFEWIILEAGKCAKIFKLVSCASPIFGFQKHIALRCLRLVMIDGLIRTGNSRK